MDNSELVKIVSRLAIDCEDYRDETAPDRARASEYYDGKMEDLPVMANRSSVISRDVRAAVRKVLPSVMRTILGNDKVFEFAPVGEGDEEQADQATDFINHVVFPESDGYTAVHDALHDALLLRNGIIKVWYDETTEVVVEEYSGVEETQLAEIVNDSSVEILEQDDSIQQVETPEGVVQVPVYELKIKRKKPKGKVCLAALSRDEFLIHPDALEIEDSPIVGEKRRVTRSDLVAMGYDKDEIWKLPVSGEDDAEDEREARQKDPDYNRDDLSHRAIQEVDYYELYVRIDRDDDGIAEMVKICMAGGLKEENLLDVSDSDMAPYEDLKGERRPHHWEGHSIADDVMEIQKIKTVIQRQMLDNVYAQNMRQPIVNTDTLEDPTDVLEPEYGKPIKVSGVDDVRKAIAWQDVPNITSDTFNMLGYYDEVVQDRTGISEASSGMAPDALQNMTAKASSMIEQAGIGQTEMMVRSLANCLKGVGSKLLRLIVKHQDRPRSVRLRDEWVNFDPSEWNPEMDLTVNTGLGAGTRERDMLSMQLVMGVQEKLLAGLLVRWAVQCGVVLKVF